MHRILLDGARDGAIMIGLIGIVRDMAVQMVALAFIAASVGALCMALAVLVGG